MVCEIGKLWIAIPTDTVGKVVATKQEILSNVSVNVVSTVESSSHQGWSIVQLSVDTSGTGNDGAYKDGNSGIGETMSSSNLVLFICKRWSKYNNVSVCSSGLH